MSSRQDKFKLGLEAVAAGFVAAFIYGFAYVCLSHGGADSFRLMWMAYALAFLAPLIIPLSLLAQATLVRYAFGDSARFSLWRAALLGALTGELLILPGTAAYVLHDGRDIEFAHAADFLAFGITSGLVPWCAAFFMTWAFFKNARLARIRRAEARAAAARLAERVARTDGATPPDRAA